MQIPKIRNKTIHTLTFVILKLLVSSGEGIVICKGTSLAETFI
jgi:hypothetical protein